MSESNEPKSNEPGGQSNPYEQPTSNETDPTPSDRPDADQGQYGQPTGYGQQPDTNAYGQQPDVNPYGQPGGGYGQPAEYGQPADPGPYGQQGGYQQSAEYGQGGQYDPSGGAAPYGQPTPYGQPAPYGQPGPYGQPAPYGAAYQGGYGMAPQQHPRGVTVLVLGIVSIVLSWTCGLGLVPGIIGLVLARGAQRDIDANPSAYANAQQVRIGKILSIIGVALTALLLVLIIVSGVAGSIADR